MANRRWRGVRCSGGCEAAALCLLYGLARTPEAKALAAAVTAFLRHVQALPWDSTAASATLVTNDQAFPRAPGLTVEDQRVEG